MCVKLFLWGEERGNCVMTTVRKKTVENSGKYFYKLDGVVPAWNRTDFKICKGKER